MSCVVHEPTEERCIGGNECVHGPVEDAGLHDGAGDWQTEPERRFHRRQPVDGRVQAVPLSGARTAVGETGQVHGGKVGLPHGDADGQQPRVMARDGSSVEVAKEGGQPQQVDVDSVLRLPGGEPPADQAVQTTLVTQPVDVMRREAVAVERVGVDDVVGAVRHEIHATRLPASGRPDDGTG